MMTDFFGYTLPLPPYLLLILFFVGWVALSLFLSHLFQTRVRGWAARSRTRFGSLLIENLHWPLLILLLLMGGRVALNAMDLPPRLDRFAFVTHSLAIALTLIYGAIKFYGGVVLEYGRRYEAIRPSLSILSLLGQALIILIGLLIALDSLNISITPLLTTLGVGGLAVALAFKDTLTNFFAGLYILADRPIGVGDYIKLEGGVEGYVESIGWRSTRIRLLSNNIVIIPNAKLSESVITNFFLPEKRMSLLVNVSVAYGSDSRRVEEILVEEGTRAAGEVEGLLADPPPFVRFIPGFGESSLDFTLICQVREFVDQYLVQHELRHRILNRFQREGVEIPFPQRTIHLRPKGT
ncbi:MAG: mechanosensitive ion channel family protein [Deltaproteobacteria bacterium]|nr:mechanosensitive ion channel family protein [Deltaproteobacteria bacterium]